MAAWLLFAWLFALGAAVTQACDLGTRAVANPHDPPGAAVSTRHDGEARALHDFDGSHTSPAKASCIKFCDDAKAVKNLLGPADDGAAPALPAALWPAPKVWSAAPAGALSLARAQARSDRPPLPIAIEFLRLAL